MSLDPMRSSGIVPDNIFALRSLCNRNQEFIKYHNSNIENVRGWWSQDMLRALQLVKLILPLTQFRWTFWCMYLLEGLKANHTAGQDWDSQICEVCHVAETWYRTTKHVLIHQSGQEEKQWQQSVPPMLELLQKHTGACWEKTIRAFAGNIIDSLIIELSWAYQADNSNSNLQNTCLPQLQYLHRYGPRQISGLQITVTCQRLSWLQALSMSTANWSALTKSTGEGNWKVVKWTLYSHLYNVCELRIAGTGTARIRARYPADIVAHARVTRPLGQIKFQPQNLECIFCTISGNSDPSWIPKLWRIELVHFEMAVNNYSRGFSPCYEKAKRCSSKQWNSKTIETIDAEATRERR